MDAIDRIRALRQDGSRVDGEKKRKEHQDADVPACRLQPSGTVTDASPRIEVHTSCILLDLSGVTVQEMLNVAGGMLPGTLAAPGKTVFAGGQPDSSDPRALQDD